MSINADTLAELLKQRDATTRMVTAKLINEFSLGAALQSAEERVRTELAHCVHRSLCGPAALEPLERLVWTSPAYLLGHNFPVVESLPEDELVAWQKAFTDYLWDFSLAEQISHLKEIPERLINHWDGIANDLNREIKEHDVRALPFNELHLHEFRGYLELHLPILKEIISRLSQKEMGVAPSEETRQDLKQAAAMLVNLLVEALRTSR